MKRRDLLKILPAGMLAAGLTPTTLKAETKLEQKTKKKKKNMVAERPPMGWNSFDAYDCRINEAEFKTVVDWMALNLKEYGYEYVVLDYIWFNDSPGNWKNPKRRFGHPDLRLNADGSPIDKLIIDDYGRFLPSEVRFPSAAKGVGLGALAEYVHSKGLKFGLHIMRGIPRHAYYANTPIKGTTLHAKDITETWDNCGWCNNTFGIDPTRPGAQAYYNSIFELYAKWGVDFIKADDTMYPPYHKDEIELINNALQQCGRPMVLSLSCGEAPLSQANHLAENCNMFRISGDFWDNWKSLKHNFELLNSWSPHIKPNNWPDADMLPIGYLSIDNRPHGEERMSHFTPDEHYTLMSLWAIARSPLMWGGDPVRTPATIVDTFLKNKNVIYINQYSEDNRQVFANETYVSWIAKDQNSNDRFLALFNISEKPSELKFDLELEYLRGKYDVVDLWTNSSIGIKEKTIIANVNPHGVKLFRLKSV